jgi:hypothetical protein
MRGRGLTDDGDAIRELRRYRGATPAAKQDPWVGRSSETGSRRAGPLYRRSQFGVSAESTRRTLPA